MSILEIFGDKLKGLFPQNEQSTNELLIELATFFYKIDRRVSLQEQQYMEDLMANIDWHSATSIESYQNECIGRINKVVTAPEAETMGYLTQLMDALAKVQGVEQAKTIAKEISDSDGEISDEEVRYLDIVLSY